jgi:hypothetical protein
MDYTVKVLLPEFLSRMIMSVYKISKKEALKKIKEISIRISEKFFA